jgi:hypothetical protein
MRPTSLVFGAVLLLAIVMIALGFGLPAATASASGAAADDPPNAQRIAIPSYFYPGPLWTQMADAVPQVGLAIINPNSGPGGAANPDYASQVVHSRAAGLTVIGYVHTSYGARSAGEVQSEIDAYYAY